jgi:hypothetical protein
MPPTGDSPAEECCSPLWGYLGTGDKAVAGTLVFVAIVAVGIQALVYFLGT